MKRATILIIAGLASTSAWGSGACDLGIDLDVSQLRECISDLQLQNQTNEMGIDALMKENDYLEKIACELAKEIAGRDTSDASAASLATIICSQPKPRQRPNQKPAKNAPKQK